MDSEVSAAARLSVAPMMDWTDRHCRYFHRLMSRRTLLYSEMVVAAAIVRGDARRLLAFDPAEHPVAVQLGGSEPEELAEAARIAGEEGYDEVNLNVGCPSDRVKSGCFGAVLMKSPELVADCAAAMVAASPVEVTVKCRLGVDDQDPREVVPDLLERMLAVGVKRVAIHARKAWLQGLSPRQNRTLPPLDRDLALEMKRRFRRLHVSINGGVDSLDTAEGLLAAGFDGAMIGRAAYSAPADLLLDADRRIFGDDAPAPSRGEIVELMIPYLERHLAAGGRLHAVTRHMLGLYAGAPGARAWRRILSEGATRPGAGVELVRAAREVVVGEGRDAA